VRNPLVELFVDRTRAMLEEEMKAAVQARFPDYEPSPGNPEWWQAETLALKSEGLYDVAAVMLRSAFRAFGETIVGLEAIRAAPATVQSTWEAIDDDGPYEIPAGTKVDIVEGDSAYGFRTVESVTIPAGKTTTEPGEVLLEAVLPGVDYNELSGDPVLRDGLAKLKPDGITLDGVTANGVDEEDEDAYLTRLREELQTLTMSAVKSRDYSILARRIPGVARAVTLDNYNPDDGTWDNPLMVAVAVADASNAALSAPVKEAAEELLEDSSLEDVVTRVIDPTYTTVGAKLKVTVAAGYDKAATLAAVEEQVVSYLVSVGVPRDGISDSGSAVGWELVDYVYLNEVLPAADQVAGVGRVVEIELSKNGGAFAKADVKLDGPAPLVKAGTIEVSAV
jgi:hypothetical protein